MKAFDPAGKTSSTTSNPIRHAYGSEPAQSGNLYIPTSPGPYPTIILLHGGFWRAIYDLTLMTKLAINLANAGLAAWNIEYRRVGETGGGWPGTFQDVASAADLLTTLAPLYNLDLKRVLAVGHSAGGQLALWLAARQQLPLTSPLTITTTPLALKGVISLAGANDLEQVWQLKLGNGAARALLGGTPQELPERYASASPAALLPLGIPQVLIHGTRDQNVPLTISQSYAQKATAAGDPVKLLELIGVDHFAPIDPQSTAWKLIRQEIDILFN